MRTFSSSALLLAAGALLSLAGCKNMEKPVLARTDAQLAGDIQSKLSSDQTFSGPESPDLHVAVTNAVATLSGQAIDDNARLQAATDASQVPGVKEVVNDITVPTAETANACLPPVAHHASMHTHRKHEPIQLASNYVPPAPAPEPLPAPAPAPPPPACDCGPAPVAAPVVMPAPVVVPVRPMYAYGYAPTVGIGVGIYGRPGYYGRGFVRPIRPYGGYGFRGGARFYGRR